MQAWNARIARLLVGAAGSCRSRAGVCVSDRTGSPSPSAQMAGFDPGETSGLAEERYPSPSMDVGPADPLREIA